MTFSLVKEMLSRKTGAAYQPTTDGPLAGCGAESIRHLRDGGAIDLSLAEGAFIMAGAAGSLFAEPASSSLVHRSGKINDGDFVLHRFYFSEKWFLQAIIDGGGKVSGPLRIFSKLTEINPTSDDEWQAWVGPQSLLQGRTIDWQGAAQFNRLWLPEAEWVEPKQYREHSSTETISGAAMMFVRALSEARSEYLYLAVCRRDDGTRWVEAYIGLDLEPMEVVAI